MATGQSQGGGVASQPDVRGAGDYEWATVSAMRPQSPMVGAGGGYGGYDVDAGRSRIVTTPEGQRGPTGQVGLMATPDGSPNTAALLDDWRDIFNFEGSPMPWLLILALVMLGFMQFRVDARARAGRAKLSTSAALG